MSFFFICLAIFHPCLLTRRHVWQFPTAAAGMNHLRKANNNFSDGLTNLKWVIFLRKQRMFDASFRPRAWCVWFGCKWCGVVLLVGQDCVWERGHVRGKSEREDTGEGMLSSGFQLRTTGSLSQARQANHPLQSGSSGPDILSGWMERPRRGPIITASICASQYFLISTLLSYYTSDLRILPVGLSI